MIELHVSWTNQGLPQFWGEVPHARTNRLVRATTQELYRAVSSVLWSCEALTEISSGLLAPHFSQFLMFLSDVRTRHFKDGIFLSSDILRARDIFRGVMQEIAADHYLPTIAYEGNHAFAHWLLLSYPTCVKDLTEPEKKFCHRAVDTFVRCAHRSVLETDTSSLESVHDAFLVALRSDTGAIPWPSQEDILELQQSLKNWCAPLMISSATRAQMAFSLIVPSSEKEPWFVALAHRPTSRTELVALGQAAQLYPPLQRLSHERALLSSAEAENFLRVGSLTLRQAGYCVHVPEGILGEHVDAEVHVTPLTAKRPESGERARFASEMTVRVDGEKVSAAELRFLLEQNSPFVFFRDRWIEVDRAILRQALRVLEAKQKPTVSLHEALSFALGMGRVGRLRIGYFQAHGWLRGFLNELKGEKKFHLLKAPTSLNGTLRPYQVRGMSYLAFLTSWGFGPCLADEMGLGKTIQTIALILHLREASSSLGPILIVSPVSVTTNWMRELKKFAPSLRVYLHQGALRAGMLSFSNVSASHDVIVTGYSLLVKDFGFLSRVHYALVVLDEAQVIKNALTRVACAACSLKTDARVALTGTPLENSPNDLWSLQEFLNPGLLGEKKDFEQDFTRAIRVDALSPARDKLKRLLEPFLLRRLKTDPNLVPELGTKREVRAYCTLTSTQRANYEEALQEFRLDAQSGAPTRGRILALLTQLKLICDGPCKFARLDELLQDIFASHESALIFTQYAKVGKLIQTHLQETFGQRFPFLYGALSPAAREKEIALFQTQTQPSAFILSLKAGGFGLNLTRATHVIHFDRWWNPAVENQATDRAHRIGQNKDVLVHKFICAGTLEDHIDELLEQKRHLAQEVITGGENFLMKMNAKELEQILSLHDTDGE